MCVPGCLWLGAVPPWPRARLPVALCVRFGGRRWRALSGFVGVRRPDMGFI